MAKLKAAVIGTGGISNEHIMAYQKNENVELYAFCDINEKQLNLMAEKNKKEYSGNKEDLTENGYSPCKICNP